MFKYISTHDLHLAFWSEGNLRASLVTFLGSQESRGPKGPEGCALLPHLEALDLKRVLVVKSCFMGETRSKGGPAAHFCPQAFLWLIGHVPLGQNVACSFMQYTVQESADPLCFFSLINLPFNLI